MNRKKGPFESVPFPSVRHGSLTLLFFVTGTCLCINTIAFMLYCSGWIRDSKQNGKALDVGWPFDLIFAVECVLNATSDMILIVAMGMEKEQQEQQQGHHGRCERQKLSAYVMKAFIGWNSISIVVCWGGSCALAYVREVEYEGQYSYFPRSGTQFGNATATGNFSDAHVIPTYIVVDASYSLLAVFKVAILYSVYYTYLHRILETHEGLRASLKTPICTTPTTPYDTHLDGNQPRPPVVSATPVQPLFPSWGTPTISFFRPPAEWATSPVRCNPFVEASPSRVLNVDLIAYPQPAYCLEQMGHVHASTAPKQERPEQDNSNKQPSVSSTPGTAPPTALLDTESSESHKLPPFFVTPKPKGS